MQLLAAQQGRHLHRLAARAIEIDQRFVFSTWKNLQWVDRYPAPAFTGRGVPHARPPPAPTPTLSLRCLLPAPLALLMAGVAAVAQAQEEGQPLRTWKDAQGKEMMAGLVEVKGGVVVLQKENGAKVRMPMARLSADDQALVKDHAEQAKAAEAKAKAAPGTTHRDR